MDVDSVCRLLGDVPCVSSFFVPVGNRKIKCNADERCSLRLDAAKQLFSAKQKMQTIPVRVTPHRKVWDFFFRFPAGIEEGGLGKAKVKKVSGGHFFSPGEIPLINDGSR